MRYSVEIAGRARADIDGQVDYLLREGAPVERILDWEHRIEDAIKGLREMPERFPRIPEPLPTLFPLHHVMVGAHRIIFGVDRARTTVTVYRVLHGARRLAR